MEMSKRGYKLAEVRKPYIIKKIVKLKRNGASWKSIAELLEKENDLKVSWQTVSNVYDDHVKNKQDVIAHSDDLKNEVMEEIISTTNQLQKINDTVLSIMEKSDDDAMKLKAANEVLKQLDFQSKLLGQIKDHAGGVKGLTPTEVTRVVLDKLLEFEQKGYITINRMPVGEPIEADFEVEGKDE